MILNRQATIFLWKWERKYTVIGNQFEISMDVDKNVKPEQINSAMVKSGYEVSSIRVENPSLEDIYFSKKK